MVEIEVEPLAMISYGLEPNDIIQLLSTNCLVAAGTFDTGKGALL